MVVGVAQDKLKEIGSGEGRKDGVLRGDVLAQHGHDLVALHLAAVDLNRLQLAHPLRLLLPVALGNSSLMFISQSAFKKQTKKQSLSPCAAK